MAVPGYMAGLVEIHRRWGRLAWPELAQPAIAAAEDGIPVTPQLARAIAFRWPALNPAARQVFGPAGRPLATGELLRQPKLAATLRQLAEDPLSFYRGSIAQDLAGTAQAAGGRLTTADLQSYRVRVEPALPGEVFGHLAYTMPPPSAGGAQLLVAAAWLDQWLPHAQRDAALDDHALVESMRRSFWLRLAYSKDEPVFQLGDVYPLAAQAQLAADFDPHHARPSASLPALTPADGKLERHENTSHISILDADGLAIASTHTVNLLLGAGIVAAKTVIVLNNEMDDFSFAVGAQNFFGLAGSTANLVRPGARPVSSMAPLVLMQGPPTQPGAAWLVVGAPGGTRITTAVLQVVFRVARRGAGLAQALAWPRLHHQALPDQVDLEEGPEAGARAQHLRERGHQVATKAPWCNVQAVMRQPASGGAVDWFAAADPRGEGTAVAK
ncbi:MAG: gamma-glutamyltransferase [Deltaproteobacteria bacterium]|nr:gamma-glutamyltransferase [Deltaproteobacteria bacterium]